MKRRSCRRTNDENRYHDQAVRLRKMTDEQLVRYMEDRAENAKSEGVEEGKALCRKQMGEEFRKEMQKKLEECRQKILQEQAPVSTGRTQEPGKGVKEFLQDLDSRKVKGIGPATLASLKGAAQAYGYI